MATFPTLPPNPQGWSPNVRNAHKILSEGYLHAIRILHQEDGDSVRLNLLCETIARDQLPLLVALEQEGIDADWLHGCAHALGILTRDLSIAASAAEGTYVTVYTLSQIASEHNNIY